jgi:hypothetical protein
MNTNNSNKDNTMNRSTPIPLVHKFIEYVNSGNIERMNTLISKDVIFTDIQGQVFHEHGFMEDYLKNYPSYQIHIHYALQSGNGVAITGHTTGSHVAAEIEESEVLVWTVEINSGKITEWRIYATDEYAN